MRRIRIASESLSHWRSRPGSLSGEAGLCDPARSLAHNSSGCIRQISYDHEFANRRQWGDTRPCRKPRPLLRHASMRSLQTTSQGNETGSDSVPLISSEEWPRVEWQSPAEEAEYIARFYHILENGQPNQVMDALVDPRSVRLVQALPHSIFIEALHLLSPEHFILPYRVRYRPLHAYNAKLGKLRTLEHIFNDFKHKLSTIMTYRTSSGNALHLAEYTHLLKCAGAMGDGPLGDKLWEIMKAEGVVPDGNCYNYYMEARVWDHCHIGLESYRMRMLPYPYRKRKFGDSPGWQGYGTAARSVRREMLQVFDQMNKEGHPGEERSFVNILLASARVGHRQGVRNILKTVWNVDVEALKKENDNSKLPPVTPYDPWSSLYPTNLLLFAVAHALGTTNEVQEALRTVDFISSSYDIPISDKVWYELFERVYVLVERHRRMAADHIGEVPRDLLRRLFDTMTSEPHNVQPTHWMLRCMVKVNAMDYRWKESNIYLQKAYAVFQKTMEKRRCARELVFQFLRPILMDIIDQRPTGTYRPDPAMWQSPQLAEAIHAYDIIRTQAFVEAHHMKRAAYVVVTKDFWQDMTPEVWESQTRPKLMEKWKDFLPPVTKELKYLSGTVLFGEKARFRRRNWRNHPFCPVLRRTHGKHLFSRTETPTLEDNMIWRTLRLEFPELDTSLAPLKRLFEFEHVDPQVEDDRRKLIQVPYPLNLPADHPLSVEKHPFGQTYARLVLAGIAPYRYA